MSQNRLCAECMQKAVFIAVDGDLQPLAMACSLSHLASTMADTKDLDNRRVMTLVEYDALR